MSENDKIRELFASFEHTGSLESLAEAIEIVEGVLENGDAGDKEIAKNHFRTNKNKQLEEAKRMLKEEDDFRKMEKGWKILNEFSEAEFANSPEDIVELNKVKVEMSAIQIRLAIDRFFYGKKDSPFTDKNSLDSYLDDLIKKIKNDVPDS